MHACPAPLNGWHGCHPAAVPLQAMEAAARLQLPADIDAIFGLPVREAVTCHRCTKTTHQTSYTQYFHNTQVPWGDLWLLPGCCSAAVCPCHQLMC